MERKKASLAPLLLCTPPLHIENHGAGPRSSLSTVIVKCIIITTTKNVFVYLASVIASSHGTRVTAPFTPSALTPWKCLSLQLRDGEDSNSIKWHKMSMIIADHSKNANIQPVWQICIEYLLSRNNLLHGGDQREQDRWPPSGVERRSQTSRCTLLPTPHCRDCDLLLSSSVTEDVVFIWAHCVCTFQPLLQLDMAVGFGYSQ